MFNQHFGEFLRSYPNIAATAFGFIGIVVTGFFGFLLKRPLQKQAVVVDLFKAQIDGYESLCKTQASRIVYLESQESVRIDYEAELVRLLREYQIKNLPGSSSIESTE